MLYHLSMSPNVARQHGLLHGHPFQRFEGCHKFGQSNAAPGIDHAIHKRIKRSHLIVGNSRKKDD